MRGPVVCVCILVLVAGCASKEDASDPVQEELFHLLPAEATRIDFKNTLTERPTPHRNELLFEYFSNGAGVAVGDLDGDGLDDVYFAGSMTYNVLYLNRGGMVFEDVTGPAGVAGRKDTWKTGVAMADVNGDGLLDIYVCYSGDLPLDRRVDELYINQGTDRSGIPQFKEQASEYGLANPHSSNQAYFFDYDRDGDLDLFLLTHNVKRTPRRDSLGTREQLQQEDPVSGVRLYQNDGRRFHDVTSTAGIQSSALTYGLGAGVSDFDQDGWMDLYVGNDYSPPDFLYINNGNGTFTDELGSWIGHTSRASMGVDAADVDNDGFPDIVVLDMLAEDNRRQKLLFVPDDRDLFDMAVAAGFHHQYMRNTLQLNNGDGTFSEIGQLAGISNTDWSWTPLIADLDNDGLKDVFITNGILHDTIHRDFMIFKTRYIASKRYDLEPEDVAYLMNMLPASDILNYAFKNVDGKQFEDASRIWGLNLPLKSTGAVYSDLDNDGDLDLVVNNINDVASVFENHAGSYGNYVQVNLTGDDDNTFGIGSRVILYTGGSAQHLEQMPARGYLSSVSPTLHFGIGRAERADSLRIVWPDGRIQTIKNIAANQRISIHQKNALEVQTAPPQKEPAFESVTSPIVFEHRMAGNIDDFRRQPLMVNPKSFSGPALARGDVNGDGLEDVFVGGGIGQASALYLQRENGTFAAAAQSAFEADKRSDDIDAAFLDYNRDGHIDLYVAGGGYGHFEPGDPALQDRLYVNGGDGTFTRAEDSLPEMQTSTGAVAVGDVNGDGWADIFSGGAVIPGRYPEPPRSFVLVNDGRGRFVDRTAELAPELERIGMVGDAEWYDLNGDGAEELIVVGEWMPISVFEIRDGRLSNETKSYFEKEYSGMWNKLLVEDLNGDGRADLIVGNLGLNSQIQARENEPAELYYADFDYDGTVDPILSVYIQGTSYPYLTLDELRDRMPRIGARFSSHEAYADAELEDIFTPAELEKATRLEARFLETSLFVANGGGRFEKRSLPIEAQFSPVFTISTLDYNRDGTTDLILAGNVNEARIRIGKYDANYGVLLRGGEDASFQYVPQHESGLSLRGDVRSALDVNGSLLFGINRGAVQAYRYRPDVSSGSGNARVE